ncbi:MAG TPA: FAD-linked oxidase C-terminal domain-containing protein, partial [Candidatus Eremiobacteraceae bacterium]|nr:FAD-linked oxidase C-terminal domain-containing protein [Candidatus Eremiobacteraceae bacterium]
RNLAERHHLTFGPDPATHSRNTLGGMIGNNSCGMHAQMAGKVEENIDELEVLTYDGLRMRVGPTSDAELAGIIALGGRRGQIYARLRDLRDRYGDLIRRRFPDIPRRVSGYPLDELLPENGFHVARALVGTENTCVTVLEAMCRLVESPPSRTLVALGFPDIATAADHVPACNEHQPIALEAIDQSMFDFMHDKGMSTSSRAMFPDGGAWLIVEFGGATKDEADEKARGLIAAARSFEVSPSAKLFDDREEEKQLWEVRESGLGATSKVPGFGDFYPGWEDSAVPPAAMGAYLRDLQRLMRKYNYHASLYGHFGQGCLHCSIDFDLFTAGGIALYRAFVTEAAHLCVGYGGSLSGEHGDGQSRGELLPIMYGEELVGAFEEFKAIWDPLGRMNPGKVVHPNRLDDDLRWGPRYQPVKLATHFAFAADGGSFSHAANRCVGTGKCRKHDSGTMCPSYMATREEMHSTRGRARLLFEMLEGQPLRDGWRDPAVKEALELCLACKACKSECPVNVDMATYKAEFLSHYYEGRLRPLSAYAFGLMPVAARVASLVPWLANLLTHAPPFSWVIKNLVGMAPERDAPMFAGETFRSWFAARPKMQGTRGRVMLWPDTWNDLFHVGTAKAAVNVLEGAGYEVVVPSMLACCGRPLYDYGMLDLAKKFLRRMLDAANEFGGNVPVVFLEPSCASVLRDEMCDLLPDDPDASRLRDRAMMLGEFLARFAPEYMPGDARRRAIVHGHCHQKAVLDVKSDEQVLRDAGYDVEVLDAGCCGMAGAFGFERGEHYEVSMKAGERVLMPAVRAADPGAVIVANGFSCREQIRHATGRR